MSKKQIISDYKGGLSLTQTAKKNGTSWWKTREVILEAGIMRIKNTLGQSRHFNIQKAKTLARKGRSHRSIAKEFGVAEQMVSYHLRDCPNQKTAHLRKYKYNDAFFDKPTPVNCYWAGFICADGCVMEAPSWCMGITLSNKDTDHLEKFRRAISSDHPITVGTKTNIQIRIYSEHWKEKLEEHYNIRPRKTGKEQIPNISGDLIYPFLRGFFDGDGSAQKEGKYFNFRAGNLGFIQWIRGLFKSHHSISKYKKLWRCQMSGDVGREVVRLLYKGSTDETRLTRKYERMILV